MGTSPGRLHAMAVYLGVSRPDAEELPDYPHKESTWLGRWATPIAGGGGSAAIFACLDRHWVGCVVGSAIFTVAFTLTLFDSRRRKQG